VFELPENVILRHHTLEYLKNVVLEDFEIIYENIYEVTTMNGNKSRAVQLAGKKRSGITRTKIPRKKTTVNYCPTRPWLQSFP